MDINKIISTIRRLKEEAIAAPTNSVGDGSKVGLPPTHEPPGVPSSKKKRKIGIILRVVKDLVSSGYKI